MADRVCPHCGSDTFKASDYERVAGRMREYRRQLDKAWAELAVARGELKLLEMEWQDRLARFQRKLVRQRAHIGRLSKRLDKPFAGLRPDENPGPEAPPEIAS